jgi:hypothetical protein
MNPFIADVLASAREFFVAPFADLSLLWQLIPILLIWILMEWYFGMYKDEKLGWNTAVGNGVTLFWIGVTSMQHIFSEAVFFSWQRFTVLLVGILYALFIIYVSFRHKLRTRYAFFLASPTPIYFISYVLILYAHGMLAVQLSMFVAIVILFGVFFGIDRLLHAVLPEAQAEIDEEQSELNSNFSEPTPDNFSDFSKPQDDMSSLPPNDASAKDPSSGNTDLSKDLPPL